MHNDRVPKHKERLATDSQGRPHESSPSARPSPVETDKESSRAEQKKENKKDKEQ